MSMVLGCVGTGKGGISIGPSSSCRFPQITVAVGGLIPMLFGSVGTGNGGISIGPSGSSGSSGSSGNSSSGISGTSVGSASSWRLPHEMYVGGLAEGQYTGAVGKGGKPKPIVSKSVGAATSASRLSQLTETLKGGRPTVGQGNGGGTSVGGAARLPQLIQPVGIPRPTVSLGSGSGSSLGVGSGVGSSG